MTETIADIFSYYLGNDPEESVAKFANKNLVPIYEYIPLPFFLFIFNYFNL